MIEDISFSYLNICLIVFTSFLQSEKNQIVKWNECTVFENKFT